MSPQKYNIESFTIAGPPAESQYGLLQGFWLKISGVEKGALWNKKAADGPPPLGEIWGTLTPQVSKAGKSYYKFKKETPQSTTSPSLPPISNQTVLEPSQLDRIEKALSEIKEIVEKLDVFTP